MKIAVASGKGGTGKTTVSVNLAASLQRDGRRVRLLDCDVECPNSHLYVKPNISKQESVTVLRPDWQADICTACGACVQKCNYNSLALVRDKILVFPELCHACGVCSAVCPVNAMKERPYEIGILKDGTSEKIDHFTYGQLHIGEALAPAVIGAVKKSAAEDDINIIDSPPGTACPAVATLEGCDAAILVTEPTPFGVHDLKLALDMAASMKIPTGVIINRSVGDDAIVADAIAPYNVPIIGRIPFSREYAACCSAGNLLIDHDPKLQTEFISIYESALNLPAPLPVEQAEWNTSSVLREEVLQPLAPEEQIFHEMVVLSGKGGTGKTTVTASLAQLLPDRVITDLDVDAADLHLLLQPELVSREAFSGGGKAHLDDAACIGCGSCAESCRFDAIEMQDGKACIKTHLCEGCGLCCYVCPADAIEMRDHDNGWIMSSRTPVGMMHHARLGIAEENSGRLVSCVRKNAEEQARALHAGLILDDGPPGTGCPVIASLSGVDRVLLVTEPSVSGFHDFERLVKLIKHFRLPYGVIINKADLYPEGAARIREQALLDDCVLIEELPYDDEVYYALMAGKTIAQWGKGTVSEKLNIIAGKIRRELNE